MQHIHYLNQIGTDKLSAKLILRFAFCAGCSLWLSLVSSHQFQRMCPFRYISDGIEQKIRLSLDYIHLIICHKYLLYVRHDRWLKWTNTRGCFTFGSHWNIKSITYSIWNMGMDYHVQWLRQKMSFTNKPLGILSILLHDTQCTQMRHIWWNWQFEMKSGNRWKSRFCSSNAPCVWKSSPYLNIGLHGSVAGECHQSPCTRICFHGACKLFL